MDAKDRDQILRALRKRDQITMKQMQLQLDNTIKGFSLQLAQFEERNMEQHKEIVKHQKETNGRVLSLEEETRPSRWLFRHPRAAVSIIILLVLLVAALKETALLSNLISIIQ